jgi:hypothetical protein
MGVVQVPLAAREKSAPFGMRSLVRQFLAYYPHDEGKLN